MNLITELDERIIKFIEEHHVLTLATSSDNVPYCASIFYAWLREERLFVYTTSLSTRHGSEGQDNPRVAAAIQLETEMVGKIRGLQITGTARRPEGPLLLKAKKRYIKRFPFAVVADLELWVLEPDLFKMTDNRFGFGKKLIWEKTDR